MRPFSGTEEVESVLSELGKGDAPLVTLLPARPGQKERRYVQMLSEETARAAPDEQPATPLKDAPPSRLQALETEVIDLKEQMSQLKEEFAAFRRQFE